MPADDNSVCINMQQLIYSNRPSGGVATQEIVACREATVGWHTLRRVECRSGRCEFASALQYQWQIGRQIFRRLCVKVVYGEMASQEALNGVRREDSGGYCAYFQRSTTILRCLKSRSIFLILITLIQVNNKTVYRHYSVACIRK